MKTDKPKSNWFTRLFDAETRPVSMTFVLITGVFSIGINCYGASLVYDEFPARAFFVGIAFGIEGLAITVVNGIIRDFENNNARKAGIAAAQLVVIAIICATFGHNAFARLSVGIEAENDAERARAARIQVIADEYFAEAAAARAAGNDQGFNSANYKAEIEQKKADKIAGEIKQNAPPAEWLIIFILFVAETVKVGGRWTFGTHSKKRWSAAQRAASEAGKAEKAEKAEEIAEAVKPKRGRPSKETLALRELAKGKVHLAAVPKG